MLNDEFDDVDMNNHDAEIGKDDVPDFESHNPHTPIVGSNIPCSSQSSRVNNVRDDETNFYKGMTFKNKEELANSLKIACLKKDFRLKKVINSRNVFSFKCSYPECNWWLRAVKFTSSDRFPNGKGSSTRDMSNQLRTELGCKISYWKIYKDMEHDKSNVRGTHEHGYTVLNAYCYMFEVANPGSKTGLSHDENGRFKYFFVSYVAWITGFQEMRKVIAVDGTFLRSKYEGVLLSAVAQDAENHIFLVAFYVVDKECDASYEYFFQNMRSLVDDTDELCIISYRHPSIRKMISIIYHASHYGCCMRHLGENIRNNFHNSKVETHFYKAAKAYDRCEFNEHFNQIRDLVPKAAKTLERIGFHIWSRAFCSGNRYNIMTSNIAESVNSMFDVEIEFPIVALFDEINRRFALLFHQRHMELVNSANRFVPSIEKDISKYVNAGNKLLSHQIANYKFSVTGHGDVAAVDLQRRTCTCRIFDLDKIPCPHAMAALRAQYGVDFGNQIYEYSSPYYSVEKYIMTYCEEIHPVSPEDS
ncbi:uncharacterized protein LOC125855479 [Solanum stenotomum]|uniref:uncharacterized protein LOC125855479 n=1 Tax=Solanum stenotomum TaxID=172797 RepID=UPI0020D0E3B2|nr:uncharacterized protein LOC125855479 [Solanum stenotomum]